MLEPYRVLDLTDDRGEIAGMMLGDLGADVIRVEPREGTPGRQRGPLLPDTPGEEASLQFFAYNRNKRSIALALGEAGDRADFLRLVESADFVIDSWPGSALEAAGIDFETLRQRQPQIVHVRVTPFGVDGPYAEMAATDLTIASMGGPVSLQGVAERAPLRVSVPQAWRHAGAEAAVAALVGHARMRQSGDAQFVDVSAQCALTWTTLNALGASAVQGHDFERMGSALQLGETTLPLVFACLDGYVVAIPNGALMQALVHSMVADGVVDAAWAEEEWENLEARLVFGEPIPHTLEEITDAFRRYFLHCTREDLFERALALSATVAPVKSIADLLDFQHLRERQYWVDASLPGGQRVSLPGPFARIPEALSVRVSPPRIDEHGDAIRAELAASRPARESLTPAGGELPFSGLKVADFSWIGVGPMTSKYLADHGATVVRVESESRPDNLRGVAPFKDGIRGWDRSHFFASMNSSKLGLALNLKNPTAIEAARRLIAWADVYVESFTPGTVEALGIGYEVARALNPGIVMLSTCLMGQSGPAAKMAGYGYHAGAVAGFYEVTGWPDLPPDGPWMAYTDTIAPHFTASTLMAAVDHRRRTGEGRHMDGAQLEM
ncbi:MAG: CoA transferase, partial [Myxococcota bacterium]